MSAYFRLECGVEVCEEGVLPGEGQDSLLDHCALHIIIHEDDILLQNLHSKVLSLPLQLCQQHLKCQSHLVRTKCVITPVSSSIIMAYYNHKIYLYLFLFLVLPYTTYHTTKRNLAV